MKILRLHRWRVTPRAAARIQQRLSSRVERRDRLPHIRIVAGADVGLDPSGRFAVAGIVLYRFPEMKELERLAFVRSPTFPYVPGLLSFREAPVLIEAFRRLRHAPDLVFYDGHGYAHPRRFGISCHLGLLLDRPVIGCAKSVLVGTFAAPGRHAGSWSALTHAGEVIGAALRTRDGVNPIFVSVGHRISLETSIALTLRVTSGFRIPRPTRDADLFVKAAAHSLPRVRQTGVAIHKFSS